MAEPFVWQQNTEQSWSLQPWSPLSEQERRLNPHPHTHTHTAALLSNFSSITSNLHQGLFLLGSEKLPTSCSPARDSADAGSAEMPPLCYQMEKGGRSPIKVTLSFRDIRFLMKSGPFGGGSQSASAVQTTDPSQEPGFTFYFIFIYFFNLQYKHSQMSPHSVINTKHSMKCCR